MSSCLFIVLEGGDYTGKGTQIKFLHNRIFDLSEDNGILTEHEPTGDAKEIKQRLAKEKDPYAYALKMAELYIQDRADHSNKVIAPLLNQGRIVLENRYKMSTCVYQSVQGVPLSKLLEMHEGKGIVTPDITFLLDISDETGYQRMLRKKEQEGIDPDKFERDPGFRNKVYQAYRDMVAQAQADSSLFGRVEIIDGNPSPQKVSEKVFSFVEQLYQEKRIFT